MAVRQHWIHLGWAVAVGAAFLIGSKSAGPKSDESAAAGSARESALPRAGGGFRGESDAPRDRRRADATGAGELARLFGSVSGGGIDALVAQAVRDPNPVTRRLAFARLLDGMTAENAMEIRTQLLAAGAEGENWSDFNYAWGALAGRDAFEFARTSDEPDLEAVLSGWAAADPSGALAALDQLPEELSGQRQRLESSLIAGLADHDINLATEVAMRLGQSDPRHAENLIRQIAHEAVRGGIENASLWVEGLPDGAAKGAAMERVTATYVRRDPQAAAEWAGRFADQDFARAAIGEIGDEWAERDPQAAVGWLETLPQGPSQNTGFSRALGEWEDRDPEAAGRYLMSMERSPQRDFAVAGFATGYAWQDPATAIAWAQDISDPQLRQRSLTQVGQAYYRRDPEGARIWLESSGLSPEAQRSVVNPPNRWRR